MKRRITIEQLMELSDEQKQRLREWWKPETNDLICWAIGQEECDEFIIDVSNEEITPYWDSLGLCKPLNKSECLSLLDIGQMIELLYNYDCDTKIESAGSMWYVSIAGHINVQADNLCDALWQAVKQVL